ncbi:stationary phase inducible protein CsiE [Tatumella citrea]|uniref:PRD domain-containing protein n=1 Tax=Tatumella citrea TaxID=53336 RepID=A0A1Y0LN60_TATCI|nr:stationary phase inducible protein CsiE [Tatumella citrea]ARU94930.1 hypothetical protein A7K98_14910 [Tatumella citrea]ARU98968.1 hypothetical protein A7K99_14895 [Tatumella citrea]
MSEDRHTLPALSRSQRQSYLTLLLVIADHSLSAARLQLPDMPDLTETEQDLHLLTDILRNNYQLQLVSLPGEGYRLTGSELQKRICLFSHFRRLLRQTPSLANIIALKVEQRLQNRKLPSLVFGSETFTQFIPATLPSQLCSHLNDSNLLLLQLVLNYSFASAERVRFNTRQREWLGAKEWLPMANNIATYCQQQGMPATLLPEDEVRFLALLLTLLDTPSGNLQHGHLQTQLMNASGQLIHRFGLLSSIDMSGNISLQQRLYCHLSLAIERHYFSIGIDNSVSNELIDMYPGMFRLTSQALSVFEQQYQLTFSRQETMLIALLLVSGAMEVTGYEERQIIVLTNDNPELEQEVERILRESVLLPVTVHRQTLNSFRQYGAPRGVALVISPYIVQLPLFSPPLIHTELPITDHQQECIRKILSA